MSYFCCVAKKRKRIQTPVWPPGHGLRNASAETPRLIHSEGDAAFFFFRPSSFFPVLLHLRLPQLNLQAWPSFFLFSCTESFKSLLLIPWWPARHLIITAALRWWCKTVKSEANAGASSFVLCLLCSQAAHSSSPLLIKATCRTRWVLL